MSWRPTFPFTVQLNNKSDCALRMELVATRPGRTRRLAPLDSASTKVRFGNPSVRTYRWFLPFLPWQFPCAVSCDVIVQSGGIASFEVLSEVKAPLELSIHPLNSASKTTFAVRHQKHGHEGVCYKHDVSFTPDASILTWKPPTKRIRLTPILQILNDPCYRRLEKKTKTKTPSKWEERTDEAGRAVINEGTKPVEAKGTSIFSRVLDAEWWTVSHDSGQNMSCGGEIADL